MTFIDQVATTLRRQIRLPPGARTLAAVSGGADSVALACVLADLTERGVVELSGIAHLNHQLRGGDADEDEVFCAALADRLRVPFRSARADVAGLAAARGESIEAAARRARYLFLAEAARDLGAAHIATGHTLEDQAETVLLRLLGGAGSRGLSGIRAVRGDVIRPMLDVRRADVRVFLAERGETFREDASNLDVEIPRNRLRHELLPVIERLAPGGLEALARTARLAAADEEFLSELAIVAARSVVLSSANGVELNKGLLAVLAPAVARRVIRGAIESAVTAKDLSEDLARSEDVTKNDAPRLTSRHIEAVWQLVQSDRAGHADLPGVRIEAGPELIQVTTVVGRSSAPARLEPFELRLPVPGTLTVLEKWRISAELGNKGTGAGVETRDALRIVVPAALVGQSVTVRNRRPGDRIKPRGAPGRKKLQDLLVDKKVPRADRDRLPVVVDGNGHVVWVVGVAMADEFRVTSPEVEVVVFKAERQ